MPEICLFPRASGPGGRFELLRMPDVVEAARPLAIGLMRKGRGMMDKYHHESLADDVFTALLGSGNPYSGGKTPHRG